jgi:hypothetical protein
MLLTYLFRICFGVGRLPARARDSVTAARRAFRNVRAIPVRSLIVGSGIGSRRRGAFAAGEAFGDGLRTDVALFAEEREALLIAF